jgi:predicted nucleotide-binding protein
MPTPRVIDPAYAVHLFAALDGPAVRQGYEQLKQVWAQCGEQLGMTRPIAGLPGPALPSLATVCGSATDSVLATRESDTAGIRQAVLRRAHDVLSLSAILAQPGTEEQRPRGRSRLGIVGAAALPSQRRLGWADYAALWARASRPQPSALLGEAHVLIARTSWGRNGSVMATDELGQALDALLPYREDRPHGWRRWGLTTTAGYALWDTGLASDTSAVREIVLVAAAERDEELSAWAWSDGSPAMPPLARYLLHAAKLRYEARLFESWHAKTSANQDVNTLLAELNATLESDRPTPDSARMLNSLGRRLLADETRLTDLEADLARLGETVSIAQRNLAAQPGCDPNGGSAGMFAADQSLAGYMIGQIGSDRRYLQIDIDRIKGIREVMAEARAQIGAHAAGTGTPARGSADAPPSTTSAGHRERPQGTQPDVARRVFVVYGRDGALADSFFDLLYALGLEPLEWERLVRTTGTTAPYLGDVVRDAPHLAQATLVLMSPDDIVELHPDLLKDNDHQYERARAGQARPNVLFELGLAFMAYPQRTIIVEAGVMRPIADLAGLNVIRFDGSAVAVKKVADRLAMAGCPVDTSGASWLDPGRFAGLATYRRGPGTGGATGGTGS